MNWGVERRNSGGRGGIGRGEKRGSKKLDNCNIIIHKIYLKKESIHFSFNFERICKNVPRILGNTGIY